MKCEIISTGSKGNAVKIGASILVDCGVPFKLLKDKLSKLSLVLLTHQHGDHLNKSTLKKLADEKPRLRFACCPWMVPLISGLVNPKKIDILEPGEWYDYGAFKVSPVELVHDVPNCGYRLDFDGYKIFYATDTGTLEHLEAIGYDLYMIEANHEKEAIAAKIAEKVAAGEFSYEIAAAINHLSKEKAERWLSLNMRLDSEYVFLHQHQD